MKNVGPVCLFFIIYIFIAFGGVGCDEFSKRICNWCLWLALDVVVSEKGVISPIGPDVNSTTILSHNLLSIFVT